VEANKRKLEELQLHHLSAAFREAAAAAAKPSLAKKRKARVPRDAAAEPLRRSGRVANLPEKPKYREREVRPSEEGRTACPRPTRRGATPSQKPRSWPRSWTPASPSS